MSALSTTAYTPLSSIQASEPRVGKGKHYVDQNKRLVHFDLLILIICAQISLDSSWYYKDQKQGVHVGGKKAEYLVSKYEADAFLTVYYFKSSTSLIKDERVHYFEVGHSQLKIPRGRS